MEYVIGAERFVILSLPHGSGADFKADPTKNKMNEQGVSYVKHSIRNAGGPSIFSCETVPKSGKEADNVRVLLDLHSAPFSRGDMPTLVDSVKFPKFPDTTQIHELAHAKERRSLDGGDMHLSGIRSIGTTV
jgi:hypothetical protein